MALGSAADAATPPAARLVRDFVNTVEWQEDEDAWRTPADLADWFAVHAETGAGAAIGAADLRLARRIREGLRSVLLAHAGHEPLPAAIDDLNRALGAVPLRMHFDADGSVGVEAAGHAALAAPIGRILDAIESARGDGTWGRLKACSRASCRWAYWDTSRNRSARWCSMAGCGNYVKMRRRNADGAPPDDALPESGRAPTLVDVAGLAGVSMKTASNVVTGAATVSAATRARVEAAIATLGYRPNLTARALRSLREG